MEKDLSCVSEAVKAVSEIFGSIIKHIYPYWGLDAKAIDLLISEIENSDKSKEVKAWEIAHLKDRYKKIKNANEIAALSIGI
ncbi:MAG: hypothetical protein K6E27_08150 [Eubacterium sp.]|nr:hypothetical protein [Eubacterium sp.]